MRSYPYVGRTLALRCAAVSAAGGLDSAFGELAPHDLLWRLVETQGPQVIEHIAEIQLQSVQTFAQWLSLPEVAGQSARLVSAHLDRLGCRHRLHGEALAVLNRIEYLHDEQPLVSVIVSCAQDLASVQQCVMSVIEHTRYGRYELLLVAQAQVESAMDEWLEAMLAVGVKPCAWCVCRRHPRAVACARLLLRTRGESTC